MSNDDDSPRSATEIGMGLAQACAPAFAAMSLWLDDTERIEFLRAFLCTCSGMVQQSVGHATTRELFEFVAQLKPVEPLQRMQ
jgi:hypothetical protein